MGQTRPSPFICNGCEGFEVAFKYLNPAHLGAPSRKTRQADSWYPPRKPRRKTEANSTRGGEGTASSAPGTPLGLPGSPCARPPRTYPAASPPRPGLPGPAAGARRGARTPAAARPRGAGERGAPAVRRPHRPRRTEEEVAPLREPAAVKGSVAGVGGPRPAEALPRVGGDGSGGGR